MAYKMMNKAEREAEIKRRNEKRDNHDPLSSMMEFYGASAEHADIPRAYADYPEHLMKALKVFVEVMKIPTGMIPFKKQSSYGKWIAGLEEVVKVCESDNMIRPAMELARERYIQRPYHLTHPRAIVNHLSGAVITLKNNPDIINPNDEPVETADKENLLAVVRKSKIKKGGQS